MMSSLVNLWSVYTLLFIICRIDASLKIKMQSVKPEKKIVLKLMNTKNTADSFRMMMVDVIKNFIHAIFKRINFVTFIRLMLK